MGNNGGEQGVKNAMKVLLDQNEASKYMLQTAPGDITVIIPFNHDIIGEYTTKGNNPDQLIKAYQQVNGITAEGGTDMYIPIMRAYDILNQNKKMLGEYFPAIIVMTDGASSENPNNLDSVKNHARSLGLNWDIPIFGITFGKADVTQLQSLAAYSSGQVYDGQKDLIGAFKKAKGNN